MYGPYLPENGEYVTSTDDDLGAVRGGLPTLGKHHK